MANSGRFGSGALVWRPWSDFLTDGPAVFDAWAAEDTRFRPHVAVIQSVDRSSLAERFVVDFGYFERHLRFGLADIDESVRDSIVVCGVGLHQEPNAGMVRIRHESFSGLVDDIQRPASEALQLFWRFVTEKFGLVNDSQRSS